MWCSAEVFDCYVFVLQFFYNNLYVCNLNYEFLVFFIFLIH
jgi:hypothetical protein